MKNTTIQFPRNSRFASLAAGLLMIALPAQASLLLYEGFNYESAPIVGQNGGSGFGGAWTQYASPASINLNAGLDYTDTNDDVLLAIGGSASITSVASGGITRAFGAITAAADTTTTYWLSFVGSTAWSATGSGNNYFSSLRLSSGTTDLLSVGAFGGSANWRVRANGGTYSSATTSLNSSTEALIVVRIDVNTAAAGNDAVYLWINPTLNAEPSIAATAGFITGNDLWSAFSLDGLRISVNENATASATKSISLDELRFGTTYSDVTPQAIPEPASAGTMAGLAALALLLIRRRHSNRST